MKIISDFLIESLQLRPKDWVDWVRESFCMKYEAQLPPKISLHPQGDDFFNTMPCLLPEQYHRFGVKVVHRVKGAQPSLGGTILLYDSAKGECLAQLGSDYITTMRTGAVAALAAQNFVNPKHTLTVGLLGMGNTARATFLCMTDAQPKQCFHFLLLRYKDQAEDFIRRFENTPNVTFTILESAEDIISQSDVVISCVTAADALFCPDDKKFPEGIVVIPVHTRGFQNCDLFFDRVYADDRGHVQGFKYFDRFRNFCEFSRVLQGEDSGRRHASERILCYNIGIALHDILAAHKIYSMLEEKAPEISIEHYTKKFWV